jgi:hypothetical protein
MAAPEKIIAAIEQVLNIKPVATKTGRQGDIETRRQ